ncbi:MAG TPA: hypothetical protein VI874_00920 [Candidatus Norongarragalinales archaeon]|nr:hypothetical protein [Candidatus Norongarragalinales archaeon]
MDELKKHSRKEGISDKISNRAAFFLSVIIGTLLIFSTDDAAGALVALVITALIALYLTGYRVSPLEQNA